MAVAPEDIVEIPGGARWNTRTNEIIAGQGGQQPQKQDYTPESNLDAALGAAKQFSWGLNAGLLAAPDWVVRKFAKGAFGLKEKDAFQFADIYRSVAPETSPQNAVERYAKTIGEGVGANLSVSGILKFGFANAGVLSGEVAANSGVLKKVAKNIFDDLRNNPKKVFNMDAQYGAIAGATEATINESMPLGEEKSFLQSLAPALTPIAAGLLPANLLRRGLGATRDAFGKGAETASSLAAPGAGSMAGEIAPNVSGMLRTPINLLTRRAEGQVGKALSPLEPGAAGNTPEIQAAMARSQELQGMPQFQGMNLTPAESSLFPPLIEAQEAAARGLSREGLAQATARRAEQERVFGHAIEAFSGPRPTVPLGQGLIAVRDSIQQSEIGPLVQRGQQGMLLPGSAPLRDHAEAGNLIRDTLSHAKTQLDDNVKALYGSVNLRDIPVSATALYEGENSLKAVLGGVLRPTAGRPGIDFLESELNPQTVKAVSTLREFFPKEAEAVAEEVATKAPKLVQLRSFSNALNNGVEDKLLDLNYLSTFIKLRDAGSKPTRTMMSSVEDLDSLLINRLMSYGLPAARQDRTFKHSAQVSKNPTLGVIDKTLNGLRGATNRYIEDFMAFEKGSQRVDQTRLARSYDALAKEVNQARKIRDAGIPSGPTKVKPRVFDSIDINRAPAAAETGAAAEAEVPKEFFFQDLDVARKKLSAAYENAATPTDRRGVQILRQNFDEWIDSSVANGSIAANSPEALATLKEAREARSRIGEIFEERKGATGAGKAMEKILTSKELTPNQVLDTIFGAGTTPTKGVATELARRIEMLFGKDSPEFTNLGQAAYLRAVQNADGTPRTAKQAGEELTNLLTGRGAEFADRVYTPAQKQSLLQLRGEIAQIETNSLDAETKALLSKVTRPGADVNVTIQQALKNPADMQSLVKLMGSDPDRMIALRRQVWDQLGSDRIGKTATGIEQFMRVHALSLRKLYTPEEMNRLQALSDMQKRVFAAVRPEGTLTGGVGTSQQIANALGTTPRSLASMANALTQGRQGPLDIMTVMSFRFLTRRQEDIYSLVMQKALTDPAYAKYLTTATLDPTALQDAALTAVNGLKGIDIGDKIARSAGSRAYRALRAFGESQTLGEEERERALTLPPSDAVTKAFNAPPPAPTARELLMQLPRSRAPSTTGVPTLMAPAQGFKPQQILATTQAAAKSMNNTGMSSQQMYQALFPRDTLSRMLPPGQPGQPQ